MSRCKDCRYYNRSWMKLEPCDQCCVPGDDDKGGAYGDWFLLIGLTDRDIRYRRALMLLVDDAMFLALAPGYERIPVELRQLTKIEEYVRMCDEPGPTIGGLPFEIKWTPATDDGDGDDGRFFTSFPALAWKGCRSEGGTAQEAVDKIYMEYEGFDSFEWEYELRVDTGWVPSETIDGYKFMVERVPEDDGGGFTAYVPALGGGGKACCSDGYTVLGAIGTLHDSIEWILEGFKANGADPPPKDE